MSATVRVAARHGLGTVSPSKRRVRRRSVYAQAAALVVLALVGAAASSAGGFALNEHSGKAVGLGGAVAAQVDDPSALFYNVGGLAFVEDRSKLLAGVATTYLSQSIVQGLPPGAAAGTTGEQDELLLHRPHVFWSRALSPNTRFGIGHFQPFGFETEWLEPDGFSGRFVTLTSEINAFDVNAGLAIRMQPWLGLGLGVIYRSSEVVLGRRLPGFDPTRGQVVDVASFTVDTATEDGFGWNVGLQCRRGRFALGLAYRSEIEIDYVGVGKLTQISTGNAQLDALFRATLPFDQNLAVVTTVTFPDAATLGIALGSHERFLVELDVERMGWSNLQGLDLVFPNNPDLGSTLWGPFVDADSYRLGVSFSTTQSTHFRAGLAFDESPLSDTDLGPFLPDADRFSAAAGMGRDWLDVAVRWSEFDQRTTTRNIDGYNGTYSGTQWLLTVTVRR